MLLRCLRAGQTTGRGSACVQTADGLAPASPAGCENKEQETSPSAAEMFIQKRNVRKKGFSILTERKRTVLKAFAGAADAEDSGLSLGRVVSFSSPGLLRTSAIPLKAFSAVP